MAYLLAHALTPPSDARQVKKAETDQVTEEKAEADQVAQEKAEADRVAQEKVEAELLEVTCEWVLMGMNVGAW